MSENLCGPSNALKSLGNHVNQDRSLHQDRAGTGQAGPSNFRSAPHVNPNAEADYQAFINRGLAPLSLMPMGPSNQAFMEPGAPAYQQQQHLNGLHGRGHHDHALGVGAGTGAGPVQHRQWAAEFAATSTSSSGPLAATRAASSGHLYYQQPVQAVTRLEQFSMGVASGPSGSAYAPPGYAYSAAPSFAPPTISFPPLVPFTPFTPFASSDSMPTYGPRLASTTSATSATAASALSAPSAPSGVGGLTEAQLEAQFAAAQAELDFEDEMNVWMAAHGPTDEEIAAAQEQFVNEELERVADELEAQRLTEDAEDAAAAATTTPEANADAAGLDTAESVAAAEQARDDEELARIAGTIANTLSANHNPRFHQSSFMQLMRRIEAREVTVRGDSLVEEATGRPVEVVIQDEEQQRQEQEQEQEHEQKQKQSQPQPGQQNSEV